MQCRCNCASGSASTSDGKSSNLTLFSSENPKVDTVIESASSGGVVSQRIAKPGSRVGTAKIAPANQDLSGAVIQRSSSASSRERNLILSGSVALFELEGRFSSLSPRVAKIQQAPI
jgi:hypothetical protein